jgi:iron(III) transport system permease protein
VLLVAPLAVPSFVNAFGWVSVTGRLDGYLGALLVTTLSYFPLVFLPAAAALRGLDPGLEETAYALGLGRAAAFARVVLPQLRPALLGGGLLVALHLLAEFGALQLLRYPTFTTAIYDQYESSFTSSAATMLAGVLVLLCLALLLAEVGLRGRSRYARVGAGAPRAVTRARLGTARWPVLAGLTGLTALALGVPVGSVLRWLTDSAVDTDRLVQATSASLSLGAIAAGVTTVLAVPAAWLAVRHRGRLASGLERSTYVSSALPGIVVALALVTIAIRVARPLYQTVPLLVAGYAILFLPRAVVTVRAALAQAPPVLDAVARSLGEGPVGTLRRVTLPLIAPGLGAGAALVFLAVVTELTATLLLSPLGTRTLATEFWQQSNSLAYGAAAPYAALMILLSAPATYLLTREARR